MKTGDPTTIQTEARELLDTAVDRGGRTREAALAAITTALNLRDEARSEADETYKIGIDEGRQEAVREIDLATGGDGEFRYRTDLDPERHCPDAETMIARIVARFDEARSLALEAAARWLELHWYAVMQKGSVYAAAAIRALGKDET